MFHIDIQHVVKREKGSHTTISHAKHKYIIKIYTRSKQEYEMSNQSLERIYKGGIEIIGI